MSPVVALLAMSLLVSSMRFARGWVTHSSFHKHSVPASAVNHATSRLKLRSYNSFRWSNDEFAPLGASSRGFNATSFDINDQRDLVSYDAILADTPRTSANGMTYPGQVDMHEAKLGPNQNIPAPSLESDEIAGVLGIDPQDIEVVIRNQTFRWEKVEVEVDNDVSEKKLAQIIDHKFAELQISAQTRRALEEVFKYELMTVVQAETLPLILTGDDCLAKAKTGTGKTLAFMIPTLEKIVARKESKNNDIYCLVISPTRELAQQIAAETEKLLTFHDKRLQKVVTCVGGTNGKNDLRNLTGFTPIVVATPGRLLDHLQNNGLAERMTNLDSLILDEADQLLDMGFRPDIERILRLLEPSQKSRQTLLFSATVPTSVAEIAKIALRTKYNFVDTVGVDSEQTHLHVQQQLIVATQEQQMNALASILDRETSGKQYKIIVFFTTARLTGFMAEVFNSVSQLTGYNVLEIHSRKSQKQRERASEQFRDAKKAVLFSSDVSARGMDYPDVTFVLQVGLTDRAQYIHRLGRTARAGKDGKGALLVATYEEHHMVHAELRDMPLEATQVPDSQKVTDIVSQALQNVNKDKELRLSAEQAYRAWLGYYKGHLKKIKWDKKQLVTQANCWAKENGLKEQPSLQKRTIGKMQLKGVPGLKIEN